MEDTTSNSTRGSWGRRWYQNFVFKRRGVCQLKKEGKSILVRRPSVCMRGERTVHRGPGVGRLIGRQGWVGDQLVDIFADQAKKLVFCCAGNGGTTRGLQTGKLTYEGRFNETDILKLTFWDSI